MRPPRRIWLSLAMMALAIILIVVVVDLQAVIDVLRRADVGLALAGAALLLAGMLAYAWRWHLLLARQTHWRLVFHAANLGHAVNCLAPLRAGEAARIVGLRRRARLPMSQVASSVVVERLLEQLMRLAALGVALIFGIGLPATPLTVLAGMLILAAGAGAILWLTRHQDVVLGRWPPLMARLPRLSEQRVRKGLNSLLRGMVLAASPARLASAMGLSLLAWACYWGFYVCVLLALPVALAPGHLLTLSLAALAIVPPSAPTAPGIYHASLVLPLSLLGFNNTDLAAYALLAHALIMGLMLLLGLVGLQVLGASPREILTRLPD